MAQDNTPQLVSMAQQFTGLPMDALIGAPLNAAANANAAMAVTQTMFMLNTCFSQVTTGTAPNQVTNYTPIMINMALTRGVIQPQDSPGPGQPIPPPIILPVTTNFELPLLTIIPLNSLGVDNVNVTFEMEVNSSYSEDTSATTDTNIAASTSFNVKVGWGPISATVTGSASYDQKDSSTHSTHYQKSNSAKYTVLVHAGQLPLPQGVNTIIQAYTTAIQPLTLPVPTTTTTT